MNSTCTPEIERIAVVGTYTPRQCGIATFTADLANSLDGELESDDNVFAIAIDDVAEGYRYPSRVRFEIRAQIQTDYSLAADYVVSNQATIVILQHEFGIYGGPWGAHMLKLLRDLRVPALTTLHTVLAEPNPDQRRIVEEIGRLSDRVVVMSHRAEQMLQDIYGIAADRIAYIPHGIPDVPFVDPNYYKDKFKAEGRRIILTFGLLSPNKGIEYMVEAMPAIVDKFPDTLYMVVGATHPHLRKQHGEAYRTSLQRRVYDLGLEDNVRFRNRFVAIDELIEYLGAADLYVTPYLSAEQITSGTLAYAVGAGKAVISTPYWHAQELLSEGRGVLVPFRDSQALADSVNHLFENDTERHQMRKRAYTYCRDMTWKQVARSYLNLVRTVVEERAQHPRPCGPRVKRLGRPEELPEPDLRHLHTMTDDTGLLQHARFTTPDRDHGYCIDDNARALMACALYDYLYQSDDLDGLADVYLSFLRHGFNAAAGRFRNFMSYQREWIDEVGSEDCHGRALWALGTTVACSEDLHRRAICVQLFQQAIGATEEFTSPRAWAYSLLGIHSYLTHYGGDANVRRLRQVLAGRLYQLFQQTKTREWEWGESILAYSNATLTHALILAGAGLKNTAMRDQGLRSLEWLCQLQKSERGHFSFIGNHGWYVRGKERARFDQQPIEASQTCLACISAFRETGNEHWLADARQAVAWFLGRNDLNVPLYDFSTGGCYDALTPDGPNANQGAESQVCWLTALLSFLIQMSRQALDARTDEVETPTTAT